MGHFIKHTMGSEPRTHHGEGKAAVRALLKASVVGVLLNALTRKEEAQPASWTMNEGTNGAVLWLGAVDGVGRCSGVGWCSSAGWCSGGAGEGLSRG